MKAYINILLVFIFLIVTSPSSLSQSPSKPAQQEDERVVFGTSEVLLDAVVKDKKGRPVKDLTASDFEVFEDGVRQQIRSFRLVTLGSQTAPGTNTPVTGDGGANASAQTSSIGTSPLTPENRLSAVALVLDRLSPAARARAQTAALDYLNQELAKDEFVGVFAINLSLQVLQPYTNNTQLVRRAVDSAASKSSSTFASTTEKVRDLVEQQNSAQAAGEAAAVAAAANEGIGAGASAMVDAALLEMAARSLETFERLDRDQQGFATSNGLIAIVNSMKRMSGRKAIIFFSEGIAIPPAVQQQFRSVIANANRANVSIYSVDAAGLRIDSPVAETRREMLARGQRRLNQTASGRDDLSGPMTRGLERNEDLLTLNPESGLGQLADQTGGILISETNSIGPKLRQVDEDLHSYYVLSYVPQNTNYDGRFRQINVKLNHPGLSLQTRKGYYALKTGDETSPVLSYEAPALAILGNGNHKNSFAIHVGGFNFPAANESSSTSVLVEVPPGVLTYATDVEKKTYHTDFSIVVVIKDESQRVVRKLSSHYVLTGPLEKLDAAKKAEVLFYRTTDLPTGHFSVVAAAYDALTGQSGVRSETFEVQTADEKKLRLSSLAILKRVEKLPETEQKGNNPFRFGAVLVYPNLDEPLRKSSDKEVAFFLTAYVTQLSNSAPKLTIELLQRGRSLGHAALDLPAPDAAGRIQYASALPVDKLQSGDYELKITISDGLNSATRSEHFTIQ
jgi:VWFA-related protein